MTRIVAIDDDASTLFIDAGRDCGLPSAFIEAIGFASLGFIDSEPRLEQLSVRRAWMRRGRRVESPIL